MVKSVFYNQIFVSTNLIMDWNMTCLEFYKVNVKFCSSGKMQTRP